MSPYPLITPAITLSALGGGIPGISADPPLPKRCPVGFDLVPFRLWTARAQPKGGEADLTPEVGLRVIIHEEAETEHTIGEENRMTKADLVEKVAEAVGPGVTKRDCGRMVDAFLDAVKDALAQGDRIELRGFGVFKVRRRKARTARNPRTGAPVELPSRDVPVFEPSRHLRGRVDRGLGVLGKEAHWEVVREP